MISITQGLYRTFYFKIHKTFRPVCRPSNCSWLMENINSTNAISQTVTLATWHRQHADLASPFFSRFSKSTVCRLSVDHYHEIAVLSKTLAKNAIFPWLSRPGRRHVSVSIFFFLKSVNLSQSPHECPPTSVTSPLFRPQTLAVLAHQTTFCNKEFYEFINFHITGEEIKFSISCNAMSSLFYLGSKCKHNVENEMKTFFSDNFHGGKQVGS